jgi:hypothetical protein
MPTIITPNVEWLEFDADSPLPMVPTATPGWRVLDYTPLRSRPPKLGGNRPVPGVAGRLAIPREWDELAVLLPIRIKGTHDWEGTAYDDRFEGVDANHEYLQENVIDVLGSRAVTFHRRNGDELVGEANDFQLAVAVDPASEGDVLTGVLSFKIPAGFLTPAGS